MKKIMYMLLIATVPAFAQQNIVYKCTDSNGSVNYVNINSVIKSSKCEKTDLADPEKTKGMVIRSEGGNSPIKTYSNTPALSSVGNIPTIKSDEQKKKDEDRASILAKELQDEQEQLLNVQKMLKNVEGSKDSDQVGQLKEMENRHMKNISSLKKELGFREPKIVVNNEMPAASSIINAMMIKKEIRMNPTISKLSEKVIYSPQRNYAEEKIVSTEVKMPEGKIPEIKFHSKQNTLEEPATYKLMDEAESRKKIESFLEVK